MKKILAGVIGTILIIGCFIFFHSSRAATAPQPVGSWPLNEGSGVSAYDNSGNNTTGTWHGAAIGTSGYYSTILGGWAGTFDGTSTYVSVPNSAALNPTSLTVAAWVNISPILPSGNGGIVAKDVGGSIGTPPYDLMIQGYGDSEIIFRTNDSANNNAGCTSPSSVSTSRWHYIVGTFDPSTETGILYIDGAPVCTFTQDNIATDTGNLNIGQQKAGYHRFFSGLIDDVQIYNQVLTPAEIQSAYTTGITTYCPGVTAPSAPCQLSAVAADAAAVVSFAASVFNGGSPISLYTITSNPGNIIATSTTATSTIISGLTNGTPYTFTVTATNGLGTSPPSGASNSVTPALQSAVVNWNNVDQMIDGFGGGVWSGSGKAPVPLTSALANLFFSSSTGIGLSLLRTIVPDDGSCTSVNSTCAGDIVSMQMAVALGARVWSSGQSPPASMSTNDSTNCLVAPSPSTLAVGSYQAYATYLSNYISSVASQGVSLYALSPQNEPDICASYGASVWTAQDIDNFIKNNLGPTLAANNQASTKIMMPESSGWYYFPGLAGTTISDPSASPYVGILAFHDYDDSFSVNNPYVATGKSFWETEVSGLPNSTSSLTLCGGCWDPSMADGLLWAKIINYDLTGANVNAWHFWALIDSTPNNNEGLVNYDESVPISKRLYVIGNYSKFVRPGWYRIDATTNPTAGVYLSAFKDPATNNFVIVAVNTNTSGIPLSINLSGVPSSVSSLTPWVTSPTLNLAQESNVSLSNNAFTPTLAAQSVTTFVSTVPGSQPPPVVTPSVPTNLTVTGTTTSTVSLSWTASTESGGTIVGYKIYRNDTQVGTSLTTTFTNSGLSASNLYSYTVASYDASGNVSGQSTSVGITTLALSDTTPPTISITSPADNATVSGTVQVTANASDNVGVTEVQLYVDGALKGTDLTSPYTFSLATESLVNGSHTVAAQAYDAAGNVGTSPNVTIQVDNEATTTASSTPSSTPSSPFAITEISVTNITDTSARITITTNATSSVIVQYGTTKTYTAASNASPNLTTIYEDLTNLTSNTLYDYRVIATEESTTTSVTSQNYIFTTTVTTTVIPAPAPTPSGGGASTPISSVSPTPTGGSIPTTIASPYFPRTLAIGDTGSDVHTLQTLLQDLGFFPAAITPTSYFGTQTEHAVMLFQIAHVLVLSGSVNPESQALLNKVADNVFAQTPVLGNTPSLPESTVIPSSTASLPLTPSSTSTLVTTPPSGLLFTRNLTLGSQGSDVMALQHYLNTHGFLVSQNPGAPGSLGYETQFFGLKTQEALAEFQRVNGISPPRGYFGPITRAWFEKYP